MVGKIKLQTHKHSESEEGQEIKILYIVFACKKGQKFKNINRA